MGWVEQIVSSINDVLWGPPLLFLIVGTGIYLTFRVLFIQIRLLPYSLKLAFSKQDKTSEGDISHFQALMTALAATVGTGNIVGVASAVIAGGPGAVFWMWFAAFFGMATKYAEAVLAVKYRVKNEKGEMSGGPMYYLEHGLKQKWLGVLFAIFGAGCIWDWESRAVKFYFWCHEFNLSDSNMDHRHYHYSLYCPRDFRRD